MPRKSKNSTKRNSNQFELLDDEDDGTNDNVACGIIVANSTSAADVTRTSARGRPLKPTLQFDPEPRPSRKKSAVPKAKSTNADPNVNEDSLARIEALLKRVEERAERAEKRVESLEEFIRNELFPRVASPPESATPSAPHQQQHQHLPPSPPPSPVPGPLPGIGLDVSRVLDSDIKEGNAGTIRRRANAALEKLGVTCLGVNSKGNGRFRLLFRETDVDKVRQNDTWIKTHFDKGTLYGEQWYPLRVDRAHRGVATDDIGCAVFERMNGVKVHKMRWLGTASVDKEYRSLVVHLDKKEEVDRDFNQRDATVATSTDTCIIAARRQLRSVDSAPNRAILRRPAPRTFLSVQRAVEKEHTRLQILDARYIAGNSPSYDRRPTN
ncbi:hypothetical protein HIM_10283 [Hirsutella minnesotensis 3608]|uniref:Uncharacterized protein n=1 Tax=Hirsutella minnesotensis 3608 TaxID=1043627 RepID=A0A0F7ZK88_9HYPO|nr:hypothetical protein HIM_12132 [Hirsutella minnesotensis 3608]KJZ68790.1 hypothetical protein HIM_11821 [Hirsutella minnesotensis 3608]KJZ70315.1 hypothetical protein HIM_10283 [Hirsutella minnesotensis 3608]